MINVGRAGAANLDVIQEVEYVKKEAKVVYLLECLQKTAPPVIIFCERKSDVDDIHEYLLVKGVEAVSIHGGKDQVFLSFRSAEYKLIFSEGCLLLLMILMRYLLIEFFYYYYLLSFYRLFLENCERTFVSKKINQS